MATENATNEIPQTLRDLRWGGRLAPHDPRTPRPGTYRNWREKRARQAEIDREKE
jgi:hypothetical protein